jgi:Uma2 family endonuclease
MIRLAMTRGTQAAEPRFTYDLAAQLERGEHDQAVYLTNVSWKDYQRIDELRREKAVPRLTYDDGVLELRSPGTPHELNKTTLARLFEVYVDHLGVPVEGLGSWTVKDKRKKLGAEADECYVFTTTRVGPEVKAPDLVIEVVFTSGGLDKLDVWRRLGAKEVWFWLRGELAVFVRRRGIFRPAEHSELVPAVDLELLARCMQEPTQTAAVQALRCALAKKRRKRARRTRP